MFHRVYYKVSENSSDTSKVNVNIQIETHMGSPTQWCTYISDSIYKVTISGTSASVTIKSRSEMWNNTTHQEGTQGTNGLAAHIKNLRLLQNLPKAKILQKLRLT